MTGYQEFLRDQIFAAQAVKDIVAISNLTKCLELTDSVVTKSHGARVPGRGRGRQMIIVQSRNDKNIACYRTHTIAAQHVGCSRANITAALMRSGSAVGYQWKRVKQPIEGIPYYKT